MEPEPRPRNHEAKKSCFDTHSTGLGLAAPALPEIPGAPSCPDLGYRGAGDPAEGSSVQAEIAIWVCPADGRPSPSNATQRDTPSQPNGRCGQTRNAFRKKAMSLVSDALMQI